MRPRKRTVGAGQFVLEYDCVDSTQNVARTLYKCGETAIIGVRADYQESGRGRTGSKWSAPAGECLLITYILALPELNQAPWIGMAAALAVADSVQERANLECGLKWPNDVLIDGRKVAGILVETVTGSAMGSAALVGVGVNLNVESFPPELEQTATSVRIQVRREVPVEEFEISVRHALLQYAEQISAVGFSAIRELWARRDVSIGRRYRAADNDGLAEGEAAAISESGALILRLWDGRLIETVSASTAH